MNFVFTLDGTGWTAPVGFPDPSTSAELLTVLEPGASIPGSPATSLAWLLGASLFTDARVTENELPPGETDRRGWWGDAFDSGDDGDRGPAGSKLWLLERATINDTTVERVRRYAVDALRWMQTAGLALVAVSATRLVEPSAVVLTITLTRPPSASSNRWASLWEALNDG